MTDYQFQGKTSSNSPVYSGSDQELRELDPKLENLRDSDSDSDDDDEEEEEGQPLRKIFCFFAIETT